MSVRARSFACRATRPSRSRGLLAPVAARLSVVLLPVALLFVAMSTARVVRAQQDDMADVEVRAVPVQGQVHVLFGRGGNIGVFAGPEAVILIDDQFAPLTPRIAAAVRSISDRPIRFVLNTHWHGDHTGGNEHFGRAGAVIVAQDNVYRRLSTEQFMKAFNRHVPPAPRAALPIVTFSDEVAFHLNGEEVRAYHVAHAHTDGDAIVHFTKSDVLHMGDIMFNGFYPFIDIGSGGGIEGMIAGVEKALAIAGPRTRIIPGHGPLTDRKGLEAYRDMLVAARDRVRALVAKGADREAVIAARPMADYDATWGNRFITPERFLGFVYDGLRPDGGGDDDGR